MRISSELGRAVEDFQRYVSTQAREKRLRWPFSQRLVQDVARHYLTATEQSVVPIDVVAVASCMGVEIVGAQETDARERGSIHAGKEGFRVTVRDSLETPSGRFTLAHELGHTLFFYRTSGGFRRVVPPTLSDGSHNHAREEGLCDAFARALLVPGEWCDEFVGEPPSLKTALRGARELGVPVPALVRRVLYDVSCWDEEVLYSIYPGATPKVRCFRGRGRRRERGPLRENIVRWARGKRSEGIVGLLSTSGRVREACVEPGSRTVWVRA